MAGTKQLGIDDSYSPDVEIGPDNKLYYVRDIKEGETIRIPAHMVDKVHGLSGRG